MFYIHILVRGEEEKKIKMLEEKGEKEEEEKKNVQEAGMNMIEKKRTICIQCLFQWFSFPPLHNISHFYSSLFRFSNF